MPLSLSLQDGLLANTFAEEGDPQDTMGVNGSMRFLKAIGVDLAEPTVLAVAEILNAPSMGEFTREGFVTGWHRLGHVLLTYLPTV